jgi:septal ring factor EnvC (AmiA/AmiB activator)
MQGQAKNFFIISILTLLGSTSSAKQNIINQNNQQIGFINERGRNDQMIDQSLDQSSKQNYEANNIEQSFKQNSEANQQVKIANDSDMDRMINELQSAKLKLSLDEAKQRQVLSNLFGINKKMRKLESEKSSLEQQKLAVQGLIKELADRIVRIEAHLKQLKAELRGRLVVMYKAGGQGLARFIFSSQSSVQLEKNLKILGAVTANDLQMMKKYDQVVKDLSFKKEKLNHRWQHFKSLEEKIHFKEQNLLTENQEKSKILKNIRTSQVAALEKIGNLRMKSKKAAIQDDSGVLDLLFQPSFFEQKGQLRPPLSSFQNERPNIGFGLIRDQTTHVVLSHKGYFYNLPQGTPVKAIFSGTVAFADEVPGFGTTVIIDHGDHYYSVYSHNKKLFVKPGESIKEQQVIGHSGRSAINLADGLYFEIRHFSEPLDPQGWLVKSNYVAETK